METRWVFAAVAALAVTAGPALADEGTPGESPVPAAPAVMETPAAPTPAGVPAAETQTPAPAAGTQVAQSVAAQPPNNPPSEEKKPEPPPAPKWTYGASADFYFAHNFNDPFNNRNQLRAFDVIDDRGPQLGLIDAWVQKARDPIGFRIDLDAGPSARYFYSFEPANVDRLLWSYIGQAYVSVNLNKKGTTYLDAGKWNTVAGAEVAEAKDNWLYSRAFLFNWAQPFFHLGGRVYHYLNDTDYVGAAITRGWNVSVGDPGHGPGFILFGGKTLSPKANFTAAYFGGEEAGLLGASTTYRSLIDFVGNYTASDRWAFNVNGDYGQQGGFRWYGLSGQGKYTLNSKQFLAARAEWVRDDAGALFGRSADVYSLTVGHTYVFNKYFQTKAEYRHDFNGGGGMFFGDTPAKVKDNQGTFIISAIVTY